jgi:S1-C subfamily serine protease
MAFAASGWLMAVLLAASERPHAQDAAPRPVTPRGDLPPDERAVVELFDRAAPSVVHISTTSVMVDFFTLDEREVAEGTGSGVVWDDRGHVVTNFHVIQNAANAYVTLSNGSQYRARLVGVAPDYDLAVLRIDAPAESLRPIPIGRSADLRVGQRVYALGNPFGLDHTFTSGIVSAIGREMQSVGGRRLRDVIQTDAAINPGNSGGALLDSAGRLVGVTTAIYSPTGAYAGVGFAIPVDTVNRVVPQLIAYGRLRRPVLGITYLSDEAARRIGLEGVVVREVLEGGPAERAGIVGLRRRGVRTIVGDVIVAIDDEAVRNVSDLLEILERHQPGDEVAVTLERDGRRRSVRIRLAAP